MGSLVGYRLTFQPTSEELVSHFLKKKNRDPAFTHPTIRDVNIYKHHPCELPGLASVQSDEQVWYFFCTLDNRYAKSDRASRTAKGGSWKITGAKRDVKAKHSNKPIGFKKTLVFYEGSSTRKENRTNWIMHEYHRNKDPLLKGKVVVCRIERKPNKKHHGPSSAVDEGQPSDYLVYDSGNNVAQHVNAAEIESQLLPNQHLSYNNTEDDVAEEVEHLLVQAEWDELIGYNELQSPISSSDSNVWITPLKSEQEDDFGNLEWDIRDGFFGEETGHSLPPDVNSSKKVTEAHIMLWEPLRCRDHCCFDG